MDMAAALALGVIGFTTGILALFKTKAHKKLDADIVEFKRTLAPMEAKAAKEKLISKQK
jgi:hypothetical protein